MEKHHYVSMFSTRSSIGYTKCLSKFMLAGHFKRSIIFLVLGVLQEKERAANLFRLAQHLMECKQVEGEWSRKNSRHCYLVKTVE